MNKDSGDAVLKKGFVRADYRKQGILGKLYLILQEFAKAHSLTTFVFGTPSAATNCHSFVGKRGYRRITKDGLPFPYEYPDRDSYLYIKSE